MALGLMAPVLVVGSVGLVLREWLFGLATYASDFAGMSLYPGDQACLDPGPPSSSAGSWATVR